MQTKFSSGRISILFIAVFVNSLVASSEEAALSRWTQDDAAGLQALKDGDYSEANRQLRLALEQCKDLPSSDYRPFLTLETLAASKLASNESHAAEIWSLEALRTDAATPFEQNALNQLNQMLAAPGESSKKRPPRTTSMKEILSGIDAREALPAPAQMKGMPLPKSELKPLSAEDKKLLESLISPLRAVGDFNRKHDNLPSANALYSRAQDILFVFEKLKANADNLLPTHVALGAAYLDLNQDAGDKLLSSETLEQLQTKMKGKPIRETHSTVISPLLSASEFYARNKQTQRAEGMLSCASAIMQTSIEDDSLRKYRLYFYPRAASVYSELHQYRKAIDYLTSAIDINPKEPAYYRYRAEAFARLKQYAKAISDCSEALALKPEASSFVKRSWIYYLTHSYKDSIIDAEQALALDAKNANAYCYKGKASLQLGDYKSALADLTRSIELAKGGEAYYYRSKVYSKLGETNPGEQDNAQAQKMQFVPESD